MIVGVGSDVDVGSGVCVDQDVLVGSGVEVQACGVRVDIIAPAVGSLVTSEAILPCAPQPATSAIASTLSIKLK